MGIRSNRTSKRTTRGVSYASQSQPQPKHTAQPAYANTTSVESSSTGRYLAIIVVILAIIVALLALTSAFIVHGNTEPSVSIRPTTPQTTATQTSATQTAQSQSTPAFTQIVEPTVTRITLSAVGDNLMNLPVVTAADANAGEMGDGLYDFTPMYSGVADIVASHDLDFIDIETILGGDYLGLSGYPIFNSPAAIADQIDEFGWNLATTATNHSWDMGFEGIVNSSNTWAAHPDVTETGTFVSEEDRATTRIREVNGARVAFLAYTDYLNGYVLPDEYWFAIATTDDWQRIADDIAAARAQADIVIVAMSWGTENATEPNDYQRSLAQYLADQDVDLVIGFGPHVIQPIEWYYANDINGVPTGHQTLVVFSLGNFLSNQPLAIENVEGCFTCTFVLSPQHNTSEGTTGGLQITDLQWTPLINHIDGDYHQVFKLSDYTEELAYAHDSIGLEDDPLGYAYSLTEQIIGPSGVQINM